MVRRAGLDPDEQLRTCDYCDSTLLHVHFSQTHCLRNVMKLRTRYSKNTMVVEKKFIILTSILSLRSLSDTTQWRWRELHKRYTLSAPLRRLLAHHPALSASQCACQHCVLAVKHPCHMVRLWGRASVSCRFRECRWRRCYKNASKGWSWVVT
jgi:hypothetical protein